jgi:hypothetical protein
LSAQASATASGSLAKRPFCARSGRSIKYYANIHCVGLERVLAASVIHHCNCDATDAGRQRDNAPATATFAVRHGPAAWKRRVLCLAWSVRSS